jgi:hypothetical protein
MTASGWQEAAALLMLQKWAAIIAKVSSDVMAAFIEGRADRSLNLRQRREDYRSKLAQVLDINGRLEMLYPENDVAEMLRNGSPVLAEAKGESERLQRRLILSAHDLMYFWMYQPRARYAARQLVSTSSHDELRILLATQRILERERPITQMFLDHLVGRKFAQPLAFYLEKWSAYLSEFEALVLHHAPDLAQETRPEQPRPAAVPRVA